MSKGDGRWRRQGSGDFVALGEQKRDSFVPADRGDRGQGQGQGQRPPGCKPEPIHAFSPEKRRSDQSLYLLTASVATRLTGPSFHMWPLAGKQSLSLLPRLVNFPSAEKKETERSCQSPGGYSTRSAFLSVWWKPGGASPSG